MLFPILTAEWLNLAQYFSTEYWNIIILVSKNLVNIKREAWLNLFPESRNEKLITVCAKFVLPLPVETLHENL
jgi:hypothetical protein